MATLPETVDAYARKSAVKCTKQPSMLLVQFSFKKFIFMLF